MVGPTDGRFKTVCYSCPSREDTRHRTRREAEEQKRIHDGLVHLDKDRARVLEVRPT